MALTARFARRTDLAIYALVATAIGLVVVGFYLPIFALGQAI